MSNWVISDNANIFTFCFNLKCSESKNGPDTQYIKVEN